VSTKHAIDITGRHPEVAITALCTFGEDVFTKAGRIEKTDTNFLLHVEGRKPREFNTASGAVEVLLRMTKP